MSLGQERFPAPSFYNWGQSQNQVTMKIALNLTVDYAGSFRIEDLEHLLHDFALSGPESGVLVDELDAEVEAYEIVISRVTSHELR